MRVVQRLVDGVRVHAETLGDLLRAEVMEVRELGDLALAPREALEQRTVQSTPARQQRGFATTGFQWRA